MSYTFEIGQKIRFVDDVGVAEIVDIKEDRLLVVDEHGFENWVLQERCVRYGMDRINEDEKKEEVEEPPPFPVGSSIVEINGTGGGVVVRIIGPDRVEVEDEDGFSAIFKTEALLLRTDMSKELTRGLDDIRPEDIGEEEKRERGTKSIKERRDMGVWEIDLHIHELVDNSRGLEKHELLQIQVDHFELKLQEGIKAGVKKIIFIHGRGKGKLREVLKEIAGRYPNVDAFDADYQRYGVGAMEIRILYRT